MRSSGGQGLFAARATIRIRKGMIPCGTKALRATAFLSTLGGQTKAVAIRVSQDRQRRQRMGVSRALPPPVSDGQRC